MNSYLEVYNLCSSFIGRGGSMISTSSFEERFVLKNFEDGKRIQKIINTPAERIPNPYPVRTNRDFKRSMERILKCRKTK